MLPNPDPLDAPTKNRDSRATRPLVTTIHPFRITIKAFLEILVHLSFGV
jgi:hypothetical protein